MLLVQVLLLGSCQALLESCMYIFVFLWTPVLDTGATPLGMVFSCFMVNIILAVMDNNTVWPRSASCSARLSSPS